VDSFDGLSLFEWIASVIAHCAVTIPWQEKRKAREMNMVVICAGLQLVFDQALDTVACLTTQR
jgi:hypothetical protein